MMIRGISPCAPSKEIVGGGYMGERHRYDAVVIGSGIGGVVASALLAKHGFKSLIVEKNDRPGGIMASYERDGFKIDVGSHMISRGAKGPLGHVLRLLGLSEPKFITHEIPSASRGILECRLPKTKYLLPAFAIDLARKMKLPSKEIRHVARMVLKIMTMSRKKVEEWDRKSVHDFILSYTDYPPVYYLFSFLMGIFFVLPPWLCSAGESIYCLKAFVGDYSLSYIRGGMDAYIKALVDYTVGKGGGIALNEKVCSINPDPKGFVVITEKGKEYKSRYVICNMFPKDALSLLKDFPETEGLQAYRKKVDGIKSSLNAFQVKLGLKRKLVEEASFIGGVSLNGIGLQDLTLDMLRQVTDDIVRGKISDPLSVYAPVPSNFDPSVAPPGRQLIVASIYGPTRKELEDPPEKWKEHILKLLASVIPGLEDEIMFYEFSTVNEIGQWMGKSNNGAISNGQYPDQTGSMRLPVWTPIKGLFVCGDGAGGRGIGTELATVSAMEVVSHILGK